MKKLSLALVVVAGLGTCALLSASSKQKIRVLDKVSSIPAYKFTFVKTTPPPPTPAPPMVAYLQSTGVKGTITQVGGTITVNPGSVGGSLNYLQSINCSEVIESPVQSQFIASGQSAQITGQVTVPSGAQYMVIAAYGLSSPGNSTTLGLANAMDSPNVSKATVSGNFTQYFAADTSGASTLTFQNILMSTAVGNPITTNPYSIAFFSAH